MILLFFIFALIAGGILNACYLYWQYLQKLRSGRSMTCFIGGHCEEVVNSSYGTIFGVKNEIWGLFYYISLLGLFISFFLFEPFLYLVMLAILFSSLGAVIFTSYLLFVQLFVLREYCSWCLLATFINYGIFVLEIVYFF